MEPIIDPMFFYWASVAGKVITLCGIVGAVLVMIGAISFFVMLTESIGRKEMPKWPGVCLVCAIILFFLAVITPSEETIYKMAAAKMVTSDSIEKVLKGGKIMKDELKKDLIDVIRSVKDGEK